MNSMSKARIPDRTGERELLLEIKAQFKLLDFATAEEKLNTSRKKGLRITTASKCGLHREKGTQTRLAGKTANSETRLGHI